MKLSRAQHHLERCEHTTLNWIEAANESVEEKPDPKRPGTHGAWITPPPFPDAETSLLVGDCLQCFRTALDHLALELAAANTTPLPDDIEKDSEFPIIGDRNRRGLGAGAASFRSSGKPKIRGMSAGAQTEIERLQPYKRGEAFTDDPLWRLHELNRIDKHRVLHVLAANAEGFSWTPMNSENVKLTITKGFMQGIAGPVKGRTQVARWRSDTFEPIDPKKKMYMSFCPELRVTFDAMTPLVGQESVIDVLRGIEEHIVRNVLPPLAGFLN